MTSDIASVREPIAFLPKYYIIPQYVPLLASGGR